MENNKEPVKKGFACNKVKFGSEKDAQFALDKIRATSDRKVVPVRVYLCRCKSWHLTSKRDIFEDEKTIKALEARIAELELDIKGKVDTIAFLNKRNSKEENTSVKADKRVQELQTHNSNLKKEIAKQREDNKKLINELVAKPKFINVDTYSVDDLIKAKIAIETRFYKLLLEKK